MTLQHDKKDIRKQKLRLRNGQNISEEVAEQVKIISAGQTGQNNTPRNYEGGNDADRASLDAFGTGNFRMAREEIITTQRGQRDVQGRDAISMTTATARRYVRQTVADQ
jgi:hypothetical protein